VVTIRFNLSFNWAWLTYSFQNKRNYLLWPHGASVATSNSCARFSHQNSRLFHALYNNTCSTRVLYFSKRCVISSRKRQDACESHAGYKILPVTGVKLTNEPLNAYMSALFIPEVRRKVVMRGIHLSLSLRHV